MFFGKKNLKDKFKFNSLKVFSLNESVGDKNKYRQVFEKSGLTYMNAEFSFYNKFFDEEDWKAKIKIVVWDKCTEHAIRIIEDEEEVLVSKNENIYRHTFGWGNTKKGNYWNKGTYAFEAHIDDEIVASSEFYIEDEGEVTQVNNPYFTAVSLKTYEGPKADVEEKDRVYLKGFNVKTTKYIWGEFTFSNKIPYKWLCELFVNIYDDSGMLVGSMDSLSRILPEGDVGENFTVTSGWGAQEIGLWNADHYKMEVVFMGTIIGVIPFSVGEKNIVRISDYEALLNGDVGIVYTENIEIRESNNDISVEELEETPAKETAQTTENNSDKKEEEIEVFIDNRPVSEILAELNGLIGLENIKQKVREYIDYVSFLQFREQSGIKENEEINLHSVFTGNPGTGKTTVVKLLGKIYHSMGLLSKGHVHSVEANDLIAGYIRQSAKDTKEAIKKARGGILFIDEAYMLFKEGSTSDFGPEAIAALITEMSDGKGDIAIMMAGYPDEMEGLLKSNPGLKSRLRNHFHFEDYTPKELYKIAEYAANKKGVTLSGSASKRIKHILTEAYRKRDRTFGNARFAHALIDESKINLGVRVMKSSNLEKLTNAQLSTLIDADIEDVSVTNFDKKLELTVDNKLLKEAVGELNEMTGLTNIKNEVSELVKLSRYYKENNRDILKAFSMHSVFLGNPGTGKTTVARIIAKIYKALGMLERGHLIDADGSDLEAGYVGQTAIKTKEIIDKAMGGVLFIDEAYAITEGSNSNFGQKAIAALIKEMEDHRSEFGLIAAGYTQNMVDFLESNPGLKSRFDNHFVFEDFTETELWEIAENMYHSKGIKVDKPAAEHLKDYITYLYQNRDKFFGNARSMRKIVEKSTRNHELRMADLNKSQRTKKMMATLSLDDVKEFTPDKEKALQKRVIGFRG